MEQLTDKLSLMPYPHRLMGNHMEFNSEGD